MAADLKTLAETYVRLWDVTASEGLADELFDPDVVDHHLQPGQKPGRQGIRQVVDLYHRVFPDLHLSTDDVVVQADRVAIRWSATGTHAGEQLGVPPTHRQVHLTGIDILRIERGKIVERWGESNSLEMMQQCS